MKKFICLLFALCCISSISFSQLVLHQYFDGADTNPNTSLTILRDTALNNIWQIGMPQKVLFNSASTAPNALITDTSYSYPINNTSQFSIHVPAYGGGLIQSLQWNQKLDLEKGHDLALIEFSIDQGLTWQNPFQSTSIFNFYGFDPNNIDTLANGTIGLSGTDTLWRNLWVCTYFMSLPINDSIFYRFTLLSDSSDSHQEGWMIDNMIYQATFMHPVKEENEKFDVNLYPNPTRSSFKIESTKKNPFSSLQFVIVFDPTGKKIKEWMNPPNGTLFDIGNVADGTYQVYLSTGVKRDCIPLVVKR